MLNLLRSIQWIKQYKYDIVLGHLIKMATVHKWKNKICLNNKPMLTLTYFNIIKEIR